MLPCGKPAAICFGSAGGKDDRPRADPPIPDLHDRSGEFDAKKDSCPGFVRRNRTSRGGARHVGAGQNLKGASLVPRCEPLLCSPPGPEFAGATRRPDFRWFRVWRAVGMGRTGKLRGFLPLEVSWPLGWTNPKARRHPPLDRLPRQRRSRRGLYRPCGAMSPCSPTATAGRDELDDHSGPRGLKGLAQKPGTWTGRDRLGGGTQARSAGAARRWRDDVVLRAGAPGRGATGTFFLGHWPTKYFRGVRLESKKFGRSGRGLGGENWAGTPVRAGKWVRHCRGPRRLEASFYRGGWAGR